MKKLFALVCVTALLTGCSSREEADAKLARGCEAGVKVLLNKPEYDRQISRIASKTFTDDSMGRKVSLVTKVKNKSYGYEADETFNCVFAEEYSFGFIAWKANLMQLKIGENTYGLEGGQVMGDMSDYMSLTAAIEAAMK